MAWCLNLPVDLVLVRHGESEGNIYKLMPEACSGRSQAARAGKLLHDKIGNFDRMFCSEYTRAVETSAHMRLPEANFECGFMLRELDSGAQRGVEHPLAEYSAATRPLARWWVRKSSGSGESMADLCIRLSMFLQKLQDTSAGLRVLVVCHGQVMRAFKALLEGVADSLYDTLLDEEVPNCTVKWYTRRQEAGLIHRRLYKCTQFVLENVKDIDRTDAECIVSETSIHFATFNSDELLALAMSKPQLINTADFANELAAEPKTKKAKTAPDAVDGASPPPFVGRAKSR